MLSSILISTFFREKMSDKKLQPIVKVENLTKKFNGLIAVDNISFKVNKGGFVCLSWTQRGR